MPTTVQERCGICGCRVHRNGDYAKATTKGRSHATRHHFVAERFFGRSKNRPGVLREAIFGECPWGLEREGGVFCYECHEVLLHNPVFLPADIEDFRKLVELRGLHEATKSEDRSSLAGRIRLLDEVISCGIQNLLAEEGPTAQPSGSSRTRSARC